MPGEFIEDIIIRKLRAKVVVVGTDYHFGKGRSGDADMLVKCGPEYGFETIVVEKEKYQDKEISSTYVREELVLGHMETVNVLMGRPYSIEGIVCPGNQFGRKIKTSYYEYLSAGKQASAAKWCLCINNTDRRKRIWRCD